MENKFTVGDRSEVKFPGDAVRIEMSDWLLRIATFVNHAITLGVDISSPNPTLIRFVYFSPKSIRDWLASVLRGTFNSAAFNEK